MAGLNALTMGIDRIKQIKRNGAALQGNGTILKSES
jgi:hypothetical protein